MARTEQELADFKTFMLEDDDPIKLTPKAWKRMDEWFRSGVLDQPTEHDLSIAMKLLISKRYRPFAEEELEEAERVVLDYDQYTTGEISPRISSFIMCVQGMVYQEMEASRNEKFREELEQEDRQTKSDEAIQEMQLGRLRHSDLFKK